MTKVNSLRKLKILQDGELYQKEKLIENTPCLIQHLKIQDQLYFLNKDVNRYFKYCDEDIQEFMMEEFPDYFVAFASDEVKEIYTECGKLDPGYIEGDLSPIYLDEENLAKMIMCYACFNGLDKTIEEMYPEDFQGVKPVQYR